MREAIKFWRDHWPLLRRGILLGALLGGLSLVLEEIVPFPNSLRGYISTEILNGMVRILECALLFASLDILISLAISCHRLILMKDINDSYHER